MLKRLSLITILWLQTALGWSQIPTVKAESMSTPKAAAAPCSLPSTTGADGMCTEAPGTTAKSAAPTLTLTTSAQALIRQLPPAPKADSATDKKDLSTVLAWQTKRVEADCQRAASEADNSQPWTFFGPEYKILSRAQFASATPVLKNALQVERKVVGFAKDYYKRPRPFVTHTEVKPCIQTERSFSYPSGHAASSRLVELILAEIDPARAKIYLARADEVGADRVIGGVHYPSDIEAGKKLAGLIFNELKKDPKFQSAIADLKAHWQ